MPPEETKSQEIVNYRLYFAGSIFCVWLGFSVLTSSNILEVAFSPGAADYIVSKSFLNLENIGFFLGTITVLALFNALEPVQNFLSRKDTNSKIAIMIAALIPAFFLQFPLSFITGSIVLIAGLFTVLPVILGILLFFQAYRLFAKAIKFKKEMTK